MFTPQGAPRPLPYPLQNQVSDENEVGDAGLPSNEFVWPDDSTERVIFPLYISLDEYVAISSAIDVGADIAYPLQTVYILWIWMRQAKYSMDLCELIASCIANSNATQEAIREFLQSDPQSRTIIQNIASGGTPVVNPVVISADDDDALFGAITFLVDTIYDAIVDFNGLSEITTNARERALLIFEAIPVVETAPIDEVGEFIDELYEDVMEVFDAQWDTTPITGSRDRMRRDLFCLAKLNGRTLTWEMIAAYYWDQVSFVPGGSTVGVMAQFVAFFITGNWTGEAVVDISFANFATAMQAGQIFGDLLFPSLETIMNLGLNNPDPDWMIVAPDCVDGWCEVIDFEITDGSEYGIVLTVEAPGVPLFTSAVWDNGLGLVFVPSGDHDRTFGRFPLGLPSDVTEVEMQWQYQLPETSGNVYLGTDFGTATAINPPQIAIAEEYDGSPQPNYIFGGDKGGSDVSEFIIIKKLVVRGTGTNPWGFNPC